MKTTFEQDLRIEIDAQNILKKFAKIALATILPSLQEFVGKKIFTATGDKTKAFSPTAEIYRALVPNPEPVGELKAQIQCLYLDARYGALNLEVKLSFYGISTKYLDVSLEIGKSKDGQVIDSLKTLEEIIAVHKLEELMDADEEIKKIKTYKELQAQADAAKQKIKVGSEFYKYL